MPLQGYISAPVWRRIEHFAHKSPGAAKLMTYFVGQIVGSMNDICSVRSVMEEMLTEYTDTLVRLERWSEPT